jgi:hypothetical protein
MWARYPDGSLMVWDPQTEEWRRWTSPTPGPQPPSLWLEALGVAGTSGATQSVVQSRAGRRANEASAKAIRKAEEARVKAESQAHEAFLQSPEGRARSARAAGARFFQIVLPVSTTAKAMFGESVMFGAPAMTRTRRHEHSGPLERIEAEGWRLEHIGYVFRPTGSQSRDRFLATGQVETVVGQIEGIYLFRAADEVPTSVELTSLD